MSGACQVEADLNRTSGNLAKNEKTSVRKIRDNNALLLADVAGGVRRDLFEM